ncbi:MAG TPA: SGNH/GDSL hydrolase family protein [Thermoanaerobaculia bacterium]|nr:SGNH/GDSL hydrolase family protein [Thermoanaerobaculia bacterium]
MKKIGIWAVTAALAWAAEPASAQTFHKYVSLGDSLAEGEEAGCVVERHQLHSYPAIIAQQVGQTDFQQPLRGELPPPSDGISFTGIPCLGIVFQGGQVTIGVVSQEGADLNRDLPRPFDNLGINGFFDTKDMVDLKHTDVSSGDGKQIAAARVLRNVTGSPFDGMSAIDEANLLQPDLVTLWIGNNDILLPAAAGVVIPGVTLTPQPVFDDAYGRVMDGVSASGRTVVVATIPDIVTVPFFTYIPPFIIDPSTGQPIPDGQGGFLTYIGERHDGTAGPIPPDTLVTLQAAPLLAQGIGIPAALGGTGIPLPDGNFEPPATVNPGVLLYADEVAQLEAYTDHFNATIAADAAAHGAGVLDVHEIFHQLKDTGYDVAGVHLSADFPTGGLFSADGLHPTNIGYAVLADYWIQAINATAGSSVPRADVYSVLFTPDVPQFAASPAAANGRSAIVVDAPPSAAVIGAVADPSRHR